jgi:hypothetical protein
LNQLVALVVLGDAASRGAFEPQQLEVFALLAMEAHGYGYLIAGAFFGVHELSVDAARELLQQDIIFINKTLPTVLRTDLSAEQQASLEIDIEQVKLDLMQTVWDDDWGDYTEFKELVQSGALDKAPQELQSAAEYFRQGQGE